MFDLSFRHSVTTSPLSNFNVSTKDLEKQEEAKLKAKFPMAGRPMSGHSVFLQKRLASRKSELESDSRKIEESGLKAWHTDSRAQKSPLFHIRLLIFTKTNALP
ncbi:unnamed protein product, partial [Timema podura]|nr:unnamed protein product [Timema podura]